MNEEIAPRRHEVHEDRIILSAWASTSVAPELAKRLECARFIAAFDACRCLTAPRSYALCPSESAAEADAFQTLAHPPKRPSNGWWLCREVENLKGFL